AELAGVAIDWLRRLPGLAVTIASAHAELQVAGIAGSSASDLRALVRVAKDPGGQLFVFGSVAVGESKVVDLLLQDSGRRTADLVHCMICEGDLQTTFRTRSSVCVTWTEIDRRRYERLGH